MHHHSQMTTTIATRCMRLFVSFFIFMPFSSDRNFSDVFSCVYLIYLVYYDQLLFVAYATVPYHTD